MYVFHLLSERSYFQDEVADKNRDIYSILNQQNIICTGYANLFSAIFKELNNPNIKVKTETLAMRNGQNSWDHAINCVYINDEKYGYEGYYHLDSSKEDHKQHINLNAFMIPSEDVKHSYIQSTNKRYLILEAEQGNLENQTIPFEVDHEEYYTFYNRLKQKNPNFREDALRATKQFLDTPLCNQIKSIR